MCSMSEPVSLADLAYQHNVDYFVAFVELDHKHLPTSRSRIWNIFKEGFRHVEVWKRVESAMGIVWLRFDTAIELIQFEIHVRPPQEVLAHLNPTVIRVQRRVPTGFMREGFFFGPITCVELTKAFLGVRNFFVRTPWQLYKFLSKGG